MCLPLAPPEGFPGALMAENPPGKAGAILAWAIPWTRGPRGPWGRKELDTIERLSLHY